MEKVNLPVQIGNVRIAAGEADGYYRVEITDTPYGIVYLSNVKGQDLNDLYYVIKMIFLRCCGGECHV